MSNSHIGRYQILSEIGRGGMSIVYKARDPNTGREVALKIIPLSLLNDPKLRERFQREAETVARLDHPHIVPVYDYGEHEGQPYLVMRYLNGGTLSQRLAKGPMSLKEAIPILRTLASALDTAHQSGIVHRDLKPDNILFDQFGTPFLTDFGIVKLVGSNATLTEGRIIGTPGYISPEQAHGQHDMDRRSDLYSFGVILFELLTGTRPFEGETTLHIIVQHIRSPIPSVTRRNTKLPLATEGVIKRALAKEPDHRYQTAHDMVEALIPLQTMRSAARRKTLQWLAATLVVLLTLLAIGIGAGLGMIRGGGLPVAAVPAPLIRIGLVSPTPTHTATHTATPTYTATATPTATWTPTPTSTTTPSLTPTSTPTLPPSVTPTPLPTATPTRSAIAAANLSQLTELTTLSTQGPIFNLAVSPDGTFTAITSSTGLELYQTADLSLQQQWPVTLSAATPLSWSPDSTRLVLIDAGGQMLVWERDTPAELNTILSDDSQIISLGWSPGAESRWLAAGSRNKLVYVWDTLAWGTPLVLEGHSEAVTHLVWSPGEALALASGSRDNTARLWDIAAASPLTGTQRLTLNGLGTDVQTLAWSPDGQKVALYGNGVAMWWDAAAGTQLDRRINITDVAWLPDSSHIALIVGNNIEIRTAEGRAAYTLTGHTAAITRLEFSPANPNLLLSSGRDRTIRLWDISTQQVTLTIPPQNEIFTQIEWSPDGSQLITTDNNTVQLWDTDSGTELARLPGHYQPRLAQWVSNSVALTLGGSDNLVRVWDTTTQQPLASLANHSAQSALRVIAWSPDNQHLAVLSNDDVIRIWDMTVGKITQAIFGHVIRAEPNGISDPARPVNDLVWSTDGSQLISAGSDGTVRIWDAFSGHEVAILDHALPVWAVSWSPDGRKIAAVSSDEVNGTGLLTVWDATTQRILWDADNTIITLATIIWSADSSKIALGGWAGSGSVEVRDATNGSSLDWFALSDRTLIVGDLVWSIDNARIITAARNEGTVHFWDAAVFGAAINNFNSLIQAVYPEGIQQLLLMPPDGNYMMTLSNSGNLRIWRVDGSGRIEDAPALPADYATGYAHETTTYLGRRTYMALSHDGQQLALVTAGQTIRILVVVP